MYCYIQFNHLIKKFLIFEHFCSILFACLILPHMLGQNETIMTCCFCSHNTTAVSPKEFFFIVLLVMSLFNIFIMKKVLDFAFMLFYSK